jgi:MFS family permease
MVYQRLALSTAWIDVFVLRTVDRIGKGTRTAPRDALIADSISESISGKAFGVHRTVDQMGAIAGPITAFLLLQVIDIRGLFLLSLIPGVTAVIVLIFFVKEIVPKTHSVTSKLFSNIVDMAKNNKPFSLLLMISGIFSLGSFNFSFILLKSSELGISENVIPIVYATINVTHTAISIPSGILADKIGKEKVMILGYTIFALSAMLMVTLSGNSYYAFLLAAIFGIYIGISETVQRAIIPKYISSELRGTAYGVYNLVIGMGFFVSNVIFGYLWDNYGLSTSTMYSVAFTLIAIIGMSIFVKKYPTNKTLV